MNKRIDNRIRVSLEVYPSLKSHLDTCPTNQAKREELVRCAQNWIAYENTGVLNPSGSHATSQSVVQLVQEIDDKIEESDDVDFGDALITIGG